VLWFPLVVFGRRRVTWFGECVALRENSDPVLRQAKQLLGIARWEFLFGFYWRGDTSFVVNVLQRSCMPIIAARLSSFEAEELGRIVLPETTSAA